MKKFTFLLSLVVASLSFLIGMGIDKGIEEYFAVNLRDIQNAQRYIQYDRHGQEITELSQHWFFCYKLSNECGYAEKSEIDKLIQDGVDEINGLINSRNAFTTFAFFVLVGGIGMAIVQKD